MAADYRGTMSIRVRSSAALVSGLAVAVGLLGAMPGTANAAFPGANGLIAFASNRSGHFQIYTMSTNGSGQTLVLTDASNDTQPSWSPAGSRLAFVSDASGHDQIYTLNADGGGVTELTATGVNTSPVWSPDGTKIAFVSNRTGNNEIWVMRSNGSSQVRLTHDSADDEDPSWSVNNETAYATNKTGAYNVYTISPTGSGETQLTFSVSPGWARYPDWSPDGTKIAFTSVAPSTGNNHPQVWVMNANGSGQAAITNDPYDNFVSAWSPDGTKIAFMSLRGNRETSSMNANGTSETDLTNDPSGDFYPSWQPVVNPKPDARIKASSSSAWIGAGVYSSDGSGETITRKATPGTQVSFVVRVKNAGDVTDSYTLSGCASGPTLEATYSTGGRTSPRRW